MEDMADIKQHVQSLRHHILGNGGKGLLRRIDEAEQEIDHFRGNFVEKIECRNNRVTDFRQIEKEFAQVNAALKDLKDNRMDDKKMNLMVLGIVVTSITSVASLVVMVLSQTGGLQ
jgi:uncharacterized coiled-coil DUF342 family protein